MKLVDVNIIKQVLFFCGFQEVLFEAGYVPSNSEKYPAGGITSAIENAFHTTPQLICTKGALEEVRLCLTKDFKVCRFFPFDAFFFIYKS